MSAIFSALSNRIADTIRTPEERAERERHLQDLDAFKTACTVAMTAATVFFLCIPSFFTFLLCGLIGFAAREARVVASNVSEIIRDVTAEIPARISRENAFAQVTKDTYLAGYLLSFYNINSDHLSQESRA